MQAQDIIYAALREVGYLRGPGDVASTLALSDSLDRLNRMLAQWSIGRLFVYALNRALYSLTANKQSYTIGLTGTPDLSGSRPVSIRNANIIHTATGLYFPLRLVTAAQFSAEPERATRTAKAPEWLYYDNAYPLATLWFFPTPNANVQLELFTWQQLSSLAALTSPFDMPPGYEIAVITNLAVRLGPMFGIQPSPTLVADASEALTAIRGLNAPPIPGIAEEAQAASQLAQTTIPGTVPDSVQPK